MLYGERVTLRPIEKDDLPLFKQFYNDVEAEIASGGDPPTPHSNERIEHWYAEFPKKTEMGCGGFAIVADEKCIGSIGLFAYNALTHTSMLGITIGDKEYWGKGYGREAIGLLLDYGFRLHNLRHIWLNTLSNNERAIRCYLRCGFIEEGRLRQHVWSNGDYVDEVAMGLLRDEWTAKRDY